MSFATQSQITSEVLKENRDFYVYLPPSYQSSSARSYPVMYLLDGDKSRLLGFSGVVEALSTDTLEKQIEEFIIVAIPNTNRNRDLTPTATDLIFQGKELAKIEDSGGANNFLNFIETELKPKIERSFCTNGSNTLVGMSFGGLLTAHTLITRPDLFDNYIILDATYVWDDNYANRILKATSPKLGAKTIKVYIALANNDHIGEHGVANRRWGIEFIKALEQYSSDSFTVDSDYFPHETHGTVEMLGWYNGLRKLFGS